ncbi:hypothetical protein Tco_1526739, partial [Tanacetum coccineum]
MVGLSSSSVLEEGLVSNTNQQEMVVEGLLRIRPPAVVPPHVPDFLE